jgi:preprotein translocase subunit SecY
VDTGVLQLFRIPETRQKIFVTLGLLVVYRLGFQIPLPGMDPIFLGQTASELTGAVFGLMNAVAGADIGRCSIFSLGIMPYISASIVFSMLAKVVPKIEAIAKEGATGYKKINQWTRLAAVPFAFIQATLVYTGVILKHPDWITDSPGPGVGLFLVVTLSLTAASIFVMWLGELITEYGIGNGASLIIMAGIITDIPPAVAMMVGQEDFYDTIVYLVGLWLAIVVVVVYITKGTRRIPIQHARLMRGGSRVGTPGRSYLPLKVNMAGVMPIVFASVLFVFPGVIFTALGWEEIRGAFTDPRGFIHIALNIALIFGFCFFWNRLMYQPEQIADELRERGAFVPGIRPGARTAEFLEQTVTRITLAGAAFLAVIAVLPSVVTGGTPINPSMAYFLGGTSVLIVVSVAMDVVDKLNAQLVMRNYEGFIKSSGAGWSRKS